MQVSCDEFRSWSDCGNLTHVLTRGADYTWANGRRGASFCEKRLGRAVCNDSWLDFWDNTTCCTLTRSRSDHHPLLLSMNKGQHAFPSQFKFMNMWNDHPDCTRVIYDTWSKHVVGCPMYILSQKLKNLKCQLKSWNKEVFGDVT